MQNLAPNRVRLSVADARELSERALRSIGYDAEEARIIADHVVDAALCGYEYSGLAKILNIVDSRKFRDPRRPMSALRETAVSILYDGGNNVGMLAVYRAAQAAVAKAQQHGFALVGVTNSWMSGRSAHYVELIARAGLVGIHSVSSTHQVAPHGGARPALGTNPIAFGFPTDHNPLIIDLGTSAFMATDLKFRKRLDGLLPEGVAIDAQGRPTRDPALAQLGAILPFGGHKGFALALAMDALGVLAGSGFDVDKTYGYLIIAIKPDLLVPLDEFKRHLSDAIARIKATPRQPGFDEIRIPSERTFRERARSLREGIVIDRRIYDALHELIKNAGIEPG
ncbi:MAG: Ldh family oxidoreductase [Betaproteobacteria bacterium]|nr:Ldh family oxidoreductase [Betaproteobacteria bacterium]